MSAEPQKPNNSRRQFIKYGAAAAAGVGVASAIEIPIFGSIIQNNNNTIQQKDDEINSLKSQLDSAQQVQAFLTLNPDERILVEAIAEVMIPSDENGPGAKEAGVIYFIDRMLAGSYGKAGNYYMQGPFVVPQTGELTVQGKTYSGGTIRPRLQAGTQYQYAFPPREFWRNGLMSLQNYCNSAYGGKFETLSSDTKTKVLQELFDNNSNALTFFSGPTPAEFFNELHDMVTAGFWADPAYGGNIGMVGWQLLAFAGVNSGSAQGHTSIELATSGIPTRLPPMSISQLQKGAQM